MLRVLVNKTTKYNEKSGASKLTNAKSKIMDVIAMYSPTKVKVSSGDVWEIKPYGKKVKDGNRNIFVDFIAVK